MSASVPELSSVEDADTTDTERDDALLAIDPLVTMQFLGVSNERINELLEAANGSIERAIDIHFHQENNQETTDQKPSPSSSPPIQDIDFKKRARPAFATSPETSKKGTKAKKKSPSPMRDKKQAKLDSFFVVPSIAKQLPSLSSNPSSGMYTNRNTTATPTPTSPTDSNDKNIVSPQHPNNVNHVQSSVAGTSPDSVRMEQSECQLAEQDGSYTDKTTKSPLLSTNDKSSLKHPPIIEISKNNSVKSSVESRKEPPCTPPTSQIGATSSLESFVHLTDILEQISVTTKRLVKIRTLSNLLYELRQEMNVQRKEGLEGTDIPQIMTCALYLVLGRPTSVDHAPLNISGTVISKSLQTILGANRMQLSKEYRKFGDMGEAAASLFQQQNAAKSFFVKNTTKKPLEILYVYNTLQAIATDTKGRDAKQRVVLQLLRSCQTKSEINFLVRLLMGNMRIGASLKTVLAALASAFTVTIEGDDDSRETPMSTEEATILLQKTYDTCPNMQKVVTALLLGGWKKLRQDCTVQVMIPISPMLANPIHELGDVSRWMANHCKETTANSAPDATETEIDNRMQNPYVTMEWKYDGVRAQIHFNGRDIKIFSRHLLESTDQYPDAAKFVQEAVCARGTTNASFIMDAEIVGVAEVMGGSEETAPSSRNHIRLLPFQDLSKRKRKHNNGSVPQNGDDQVQIKVFAFDLMYWDGQSLMAWPLWNRQDLLRLQFRENGGFAMVSSKSMHSFDESLLRSFLNEAVRGGAEGLMLKLSGSTSLANGTTSRDSPVLTTVGPPSSTASSPYEAGTRSHSWLKVKRDYVQGFADTIDVVPIGAWHGHGRKAKKDFLSPVLLAVYDPDEEVFKSISRCMSFTDDMYNATREFYFHGTPYPPHVGIEGGDRVEVISESNSLGGGGVDDESDHDNPDEEGGDGGKEMVDSTLIDVGANCFPNRPSNTLIVTNESPPIWFRPMEVWEVSFADLTLSRQHTAASGLLVEEASSANGRGVALRFPRFIRRRPDKHVEQATTCLQIANMFAQQSKQQAPSTM